MGETEIEVSETIVNNGNDDEHDGLTERISL